MIYRRRHVCVLIALLGVAGGAVGDEWSIDLVARGGWDSGLRTITHSDGSMAVLEGWSSHLLPCTYKVDPETLKQLNRRVLDILAMAYELPREEPKLNCADETSYQIAITPVPRVRGRPWLYEQRFSGVRECAPPDLPEEWFSLAQFWSQYGFEKLEQCKAEQGA